MKFVSLPGFEKDLKRLRRTFKSMNDDIMVIRKVLGVRPGVKEPFSSLLGERDGTAIIHVRQMASKCRKGTGAISGLNLIYGYRESEQTIICMGIFDAKEAGRMKVILKRKWK